MTAFAEEKSECAYSWGGLRPPAGSDMTVQLISGWTMSDGFLFEWIRITGNDSDGIQSVSQESRFLFAPEASDISCHLYSQETLQHFEKSMCYVMVMKTEDAPLLKHCGYNTCF